MKERIWPSEWLRGVISLAVLSVVAEGETYGYVIAQRLATGGLGTIRGGTLYPILNRLEDEGSLASSWREGAGGPGRKFYLITPSGTTRLDQLRSDWRRFVSNATSVIDPGEHEDV